MLSSPASSTRPSCLPPSNQRHDENVLDSKTKTDGAGLEFFPPSPNDNNRKNNNFAKPHKGDERESCAIRFNASLVVTPSSKPGQEDKDDKCNLIKALINKKIPWMLEPFLNEDEKSEFKSFSPNEGKEKLEFILQKACAIEIPRKGTDVSQLSGKPSHSAYVKLFEVLVYFQKQYDLEDKGNYKEPFKIIEKKAAIIKNIAANNLDSKKHLAESHKITLLSYENLIKKLEENKKSKSKIDKNEKTKANLKRIQEEIKTQIKKQDDILTSFDNFDETQNSFSEYSKLEQELRKICNKCVFNFNKNFILAQSELLTAALKGETKINPNGPAHVQDEKFYGEHLILNRAHSPEFLTIASSSTRDNNAESGSLINPFQTKTVESEAPHKIVSSQFHCGAIHTEKAAAQYAIKMLLGNAKQDIVDGEIYLVDTRLLKNRAYFFEARILNKHRKLIEKFIASFRSMDISKEWLVQNGLSLTSQQIDKLNKLKNKKIKFLSLNFSSYSRWRLGGPDSRTVKELKLIYNLMKDKNKSDLFKTRLEDLEKILTYKWYNPFTWKHYYLSGKTSLVPAMVASDLLNLCGGTMSIGCKSNKDRGSNAIIFNFMTKDIFVHRFKMQTENNLNAVPVLSLINFKVETAFVSSNSPSRLASPSFTIRNSSQEISVSQPYLSVSHSKLDIHKTTYLPKPVNEAQIVNQILYQNIFYMPTLYNAGKGGNKGPKLWLKDYLVPAMGKKAYRNYKAVNKHHSKDSKS